MCLVRRKDVILIIGFHTVSSQINGQWRHNDRRLSLVAFDVMGEVSFSRSFGFLKNGHDIDNIIKSLSRRFKYCAVVRDPSYLGHHSRTNNQ